MTQQEVEQTDENIARAWVLQKEMEASLRLFETTRKEWLHTISKMNPEEFQVYRKMEN